MTAPFRIGIGFDAHPFAPPGERSLVLGGVTIPHHRGLAGYSDADALLHALGDAILGALGMEDLGHHFPDTEPAWQGAASATILASVAGMMSRAGYTPANVDTVLIAQEPRLAPFMEQMKVNIGHLLGIPPTMVGIKATTTEQMGFTGRGEGIAAMAVVLLTQERSVHG